MQQLTKVMLIVLLAVTPLRASLANAGADGELPMAHDMSTQVQVTESDDSACCCIHHDCIMQGCDQCNSFTPVVLVLEVQYVRTTHQASSTPYRKLFFNRASSPLLHPPRV